MTINRHWTVAEELLVLQRAAEGASAREIAREIGGGATKNMVLGQLFRHKVSEGHVPQKQPPRRTPHPKRSEIVQLRVQGLWNGDIAAKLGISIANVGVQLRLAQRKGELASALERISA